jgi:dienelactone hydrolase
MRSAAFERQPRLKVRRRCASRITVVVTTVSPLLRRGMPILLLCNVKAGIAMKGLRSYALSFLLLLAAPAADAATTVRLPGWACNPDNDRIFRSGLQANEWVPRMPTHGSGGAYPGRQQRTLAIPGLGSGTQKIHLYIPPGYNPAYPAPLMLALHGTAGTMADSYAQDVRNTWQTIAQTRGFIVAAPVANGFNGSWSSPDDTPPNDFTFLAAVMADLRAAYNIDDSRIQLWGFSAGGHLAHHLLVNGPIPALDENHVSSYAVSAGRLFALACDGDDEAGCQDRLDTQARKLPLDIHLGNNDPMTLPPYNAILDPQRFTDAGWVEGDTFQYHLFVGGHTYAASHMQAIWDFACRFALSP